MSPTRKGKMTRARILNCAKELYYENGFDKTTIQAIADKAGSTLGSMTYHFSTKADFVDTLFSDYHGAIEQTIDTVAPRMKHSDFIRKQIFVLYIYYHNIFVDPQITQFYHEILKNDEYYQVVRGQMDYIFKQELSHLGHTICTASIISDRGAHQACLNAYCSGELDMTVDGITTFAILYTTRCLRVSDEEARKDIKDARRFLKTYGHELEKIRLIP